MVFVSHMLKLKYPLTVIVHSHLLHYDGENMFCCILYYAFIEVCT